MLQTLMPNWQTIKSLLRAYAQADGVVLFHTSKPKVASQMAQPYVDQTVQAIKTSTDAPVLAGSIKFGMMTAAGIVDFFGPIAEEKISESVVRMGKELLNGSFALTTRFANLMVGPASELPKFENNVAWTEWTWSAAGYLLGARSVMNGRGTPAPMMVEANGPMMVATGVATFPGLPQRFPMILMVRDGEHSGQSAPKKTTNHVPDKEALQALYIHFKGKVAAMAAHLKVTRTAVYDALHRFGLDAHLPVRSRRPHPEKGLERALPSNDQLAMAYVKNRYNWAAVADESGISYATIYIRIDKALQNGASLLKLLIEVQRQIGHITDDHIAAVLITHELDLQRSAGFLRMTPDEILLRARQAPFGSHLHLMQGLKPK